MSFDTNALYRRPQIAELRDRSQEDPRESTAGDHGLAYVGLDGNIGCIINGAGLAMATMDMIKLAGGEPANFLDIGGGASPERVVRAFRTVLSDKNVDGDAGQHLRRHQPLRLGRRGRGRGIPRGRDRAAGRRAPVGHQGRGGARDHRRASGLPIVTADTLADAAAKAVAALPRQAA